MTVNRRMVEMPGGEVGLKGYIDINGNDRPPCGTCVYKDRMTVEEPCYSCISIIDLALHKPDYETEFVNYREKKTQKTMR